VDLLPTRKSWVWLHRWLGLAMAIFLAIVGLTGSLLAFYPQLEHLCAPQLFAQARPGVPLLDLATLAERAQAQVPHGKVTAVYQTEVGQASIAFVPRIDPTTGVPWALGFDEYYVDPWTGDALGHRRGADLSEGLVNLPRFIYELHWELALGGFGQWLLGITALAWTLDAFNGAYLTLPRVLAGFWRRWRPAWLVRRDANALRLNFDLHRAGGLWLWPLLLVFGWSSVMMNIRPVYESVMGALSDYQSDAALFRDGARPVPEPALGWRAAQARGEQLMARAGRERGFGVGQPLSLGYFASNGAWFYEVRGSRDLFERAPKGGGTWVMFDGDTGALRQVTTPTGEHAGNTIESWLYALHMARVFGWPYRILVCVAGLVVSMLSVTGIYLWWRKRRARIAVQRRQSVSE
jgi:uncharacterized iron-regulated membrane protein